MLARVGGWGSRFDGSASSLLAHPARDPSLHMHTQVLKSASALGESFGSRHVRELHTLLALQPSSSKVDALALTLTPTLALALALTLTPSP